MHSMTGFGRAEYATDTFVARVEVTSINRKQSEVLIQMPRIYSELEAGLRKRVLSKISRGRVTVNIMLESAADKASVLKLDTDKVLALKQEMDRMADAVGSPLELKASDILNIPGVILTDDQEVDIDSAKAAMEPALDQGLEALITMRKKEGVHLKSDTLARLTALEKETSQIQAHAPSVITRYRENLHKKLSDQGVSGLEIDLSDERVLKEIAIFAERCDISEEITRLDSHFNKFREYIDSNAPVGRSLDFLCQELNREFNTIGSKANDATLAQHVVNAKTELEKIREQIQNVE